MVYKIFDRKTGSGAYVNKELSQELNTPKVKKIKRRNVYARFRDNIWRADLA